MSTKTSFVMRPETTQMTSFFFFDKKIRNRRTGNYTFNMGKKYIYCSLLTKNKMLSPRGPPLCTQVLVHKLKLCIIFNQ